MMLKYYYDDGIAASYMAKYFGLKLCAVHSDEQMTEYGLPESDRVFDWYDAAAASNWGAEVETVADAVTFIENASNKIYIHPGSLDILEPQSCDVVRYLESHNANVSVGLVKRLSNGDIVVDLGKSKTTIDFDAERMRIIERQGLPFFWPEREAG